MLTTNQNILIHIPRYFDIQIDIESVGVTKTVGCEISLSWCCGDPFPCPLLKAVIKTGEEKTVGVDWQKLSSMTLSLEVSFYNSQD